MFRNLFNTPRTTPKISLWWDLGALPIEFRIKKRKLALLFHILSLEETDLAKQIFEEQYKYKFPGLAMEANEFIRELNLPNIIENRNLKISKQKWKNLVRQAIDDQCTSFFKSSLSKFEKIKETMKNEIFCKKKYLIDMNMIEAQTYFKFRTHMTNVKFNYKNTKQYSSDLWKYDSCMTSIDTQSHILWCPAY